MKLRLALSLLVAGAMAWRVWRDGQAARRGEEMPPPVEPLLLPGFVLLTLLGCVAADRLWPSHGWAATAALLLFGRVFLVTGVYFLLLVCLLPLLRRTVSARTCALLWVLPNCLYLVGSVDNLSKTKPVLFVPLPGTEAVRVLIGIWLAGFAVVFAGQMLGHLRFRRRLLRLTKPVDDPAVRAQWAGVWRSVWEEEPISLFRSPQVSTPLTVGCFRSTIVLVLPERDYAPEELELIFRHEAHHIRRKDMRVKLFLAFCTALCWFHPLMWLARKRAFEDLELSCDEEVLLHADPDTRRRYAALLLRTAGDSRGFSTCLSASAVSLRARLKNVLKPKRKRAGAVSAGAAVLFLLMASGSMAFAERPAPAAESVFSRLPEGTVVSAVGFDTEEGWRGADSWEEEALLDYLGTLSVRRVYSLSYQNGTRPWLNLSLDKGEAHGSMCLVDGVLLLDVPDGRFEYDRYIVEDEIDWAYIEGLL